MANFNSSLRAAHDQRLASKDDVFIPSHDDNIYIVKAEKTEFIPDSLASYPVISGLSGSSFPAQLATLNHDNLDRWDSMSRATSASSCATFSSVASRSSSRTSRDMFDPNASRHSDSNKIRTRNFRKLGERFECILCTKSFTRFDNLRSHMRMHANQRSFKLTQDTNVFSNDVEQRRRETSHSRNKKFKSKEPTRKDKLLQQHGQQGCGQASNGLDSSNLCLRLDAGKDCTQSILEEDFDSRLLTHCIEEAGQGFQDVMDHETQLPGHSEAQYSGGTMATWSEFGQEHVCLRDNSTPKECCSSACHLPSDSSWGTLSTLSSNDFHTERRSNAFDSSFFNNLGNNGFWGQDISPYSMAPMYYNYDTLQEQSRVNESQAGRINYTDETSNTEHQQVIKYETSKKPDWNHWMGIMDVETCEQLTAWMPGPEATHDFGHSQVTTIHALDAENLTRDSYGLETLFNDVEQENEVFDEAEKNLHSSRNNFNYIDQATMASPSGGSFPTSDGTLGKASPYSPPDRDSDSEYCFEEEAESSLDEDRSVVSPSSPILNMSDLSAPKQILIVDVLHAFWNVYNKEFPRIISICTALAAHPSRTATSGRADGPSTGTASAVGKSSCAATPLSGASMSGSKRGHSDNDPPDDGDQGPMKPTQEPLMVPKDQVIIRYACPFRKHNPRRYNIHQYQNCALGSFSSIARVKEHLYRRHMAPVQCVRCWLFFKDHESLNIHISAANICECREGEAAEGITQSIEKRLRSRKKPTGTQTDSDRWRDIYRMLFVGVTDEDVPSPFYENVEDEAAQASASFDIPIEDYMRQEIPQIFTSRLQVEVDSMNLEDTGLLDDISRLRETFIARMTTLINEASNIAVETYRQRLSVPSSSDGSFPNPSPDMNRTALRQSENVFTDQRGGALASPQRIPSAVHSNVDDSFPVDSNNLTARAAEAEYRDYRTDSYVQLNQMGIPHVHEPHHPVAEGFESTQNFQQTQPNDGFSYDNEWTMVSKDWPYNWDVDAPA